MEPSGVVQAQAGNAAVTAAMGAKPPGRWPGPMMLAGQNLVGNQAVAAQAGARQQPARKPEPAKKKAPPRPDQQGTEDKGAKKEADTPGAAKEAPGAGGAVRPADGMSLARPERLALPSFGRRFGAPATLPTVRAQTAADRDALSAAGRAFARLVERARRAHDAQVALLARVGRAALGRHDRVEGRARSRVAGAEAELDDLRVQAQGTVDVAYQDGVVGLDLAVRRGRRLVAAASTRALRRVRANANTAGDQITVIVNDLASGYTDVLEQSAVEVTTAGGEAIQAVQDFGASASTLFPGGVTPLAAAENEARRKAVPSVAAAAVTSLRDASSSQADAYRGQIDVVRKQFSESELAKALTTRKNEIDT